MMGNTSERGRGRCFYLSVKEEAGLLAALYIFGLLPPQGDLKSALDQWWYLSRIDSLRRNVQTEEFPHRCLPKEGSTTYHLEFKSYWGFDRGYSAVQTT